MKTSSPRTARGITIIELLVALVIVGVLATLAGPALGGYFATQRLKGSTEELFADLQFARLRSVERNAPVTLAMSGTGYRIDDGLPPPPVTPPLKAVTLTNGSSISAGSTMVVSFDPVRSMATITNGPSVTVANSSTAGTLRITVSAMGRVNICAPSGSVRGYESC